jgi:hypothetical protein
MLHWPVNAFAGVLLVALGMQAPPGLEHFSSLDECGFAFEYPNDWVVVPRADAPLCSVRLRPRDFAAQMKETRVDYFTLDVAVEYGPFLAIAAERDFDFVKSQWVLVGRHFMKTDAEVVSTERWQGLRGYVVTGCYDVAGRYAGLCEEPALLLRDDDDNIWSMRGGTESERAFDAILATFRFRAR